MKLYHLMKAGKRLIALETADGVKDLGAFWESEGTAVPETMCELMGRFSVQALRMLSDALAKTPSIDISDAVYLPPVEHPEKVMCVGLNYRDHIAEMKTWAEPEYPVLYAKFANAVTAHNCEITLPTIGDEVDYEAELVVIIGRTVKNIGREEALDAVFGYTCGNDLSIRELQLRSGQWMIGKTQDGFAPMGPCILLNDGVNPNALNITLRRNGEVYQASNTSHFIFDVQTIVSYASQFMTLRPGDVIFTGTPQGVIKGMPSGAQDWLHDGDELEVSIEGIGTLSNRMVR